MDKPKYVGRPLTDYLYSKATRMHVPLSGTFELSPVCNFNCKMCYVRKTADEVKRSPRPIMELDDWRRIAREARDAGMLELLLTGGEPLLWGNFWTLYEELVDMGFLVSINTNGSLIDESAVQRFLRRPPQKINITLYGAGNSSYRNLCGAPEAFEKVDFAVRRLLEVGLTVRINCSLTPENAADIDKIVDYAAERDTVLSLATYMFPPVRRDPTKIGVNERFTPEESAEYFMRYMRRYHGEEKYRAYTERFLNGDDPFPVSADDCGDPSEDEHIRCRAGRASFWITWDGYMSPCGMMTTPRVDVRELPFSEAWQNLVAETEKILLSGTCGKCAHRDKCHPCAAIAYAETGSFSCVPAYRCETVRKMCEIAQKNV